MKASKPGVPPTVISLHMPEIRWQHCVPLPYIPQPFPDEVLSSWVQRTGADYGLNFSSFSRNLGLGTTTPSQLDNIATASDHLRIAISLRVSPNEVASMRHKGVKSPERCLLDTHTPIQFCHACRMVHETQTKQIVELKSWFEYWSFECVRCDRLFSSLTALQFSFPNPRYEDPGWYHEVLPHARSGASQLLKYSRHPDRYLISPVMVLELMSMRASPLPYEIPTRDWSFVTAKSSANHCIAEIMIPGLREKLDYAPLIPTLWSVDHPVRNVLARMLLLAALAIFQSDPAGAWARIKGSLSDMRKKDITWWFDRLPNSAAEHLSSASSKIRKRLIVSSLQQC